MITVAEALDHLFALVAPLPPETVPLAEAAGRVLAKPAVAGRDQPPFAASAMDGYALAGADAHPGAVFRVIGEAAAGRRFAGRVGPGEAVRIFTGAPIPESTDRVVIQEDVTREGDIITLRDRLDTGPHIRPAGGDFRAGTTLDAPRRLRPTDIALLAAMNVAQVRVTRWPEVAILATGDELVMPGEAPGPDQIVASNSFGLKALLQEAGARARLLPIARDTRTALTAGFRLAHGADLLLTIGGASVGDHDLVGAVAGDLGMERSFYKVAMRPGKPLMAGRLGEMAMIGLPGNPVSAMVCGHVFVLPFLRAMQGFPPAAAPRLASRYAVDVPQNGPREHYLRARLDPGGLTPAPRQDSSFLSVLHASDALLVRAANDPPRRAGDPAAYLPM